MITQQINSAIELIHHPERMDRSTIPVIREALERYPFYQTLHLLLLQNMYKVHDPGFSKQLKVSALRVADRAVLFDMVEGLNYAIPVMRLDDEETQGQGGDKTLALIDNFLKGVEEQPGGGSQSENSADYSLFLEQLPDIGDPAEYMPAPKPKAKPIVEPQPVVSDTTSPSVDVPDSESDTISGGKLPTYEEDEEFTVPFITGHLNDSPSDEAPQIADDPIDEEQKTEFYTETMAGLYIKQHKYEQALEIINALSADNPKKSVYFADQMRYLELLIRINKNKNNRNV